MSVLITAKELEAKLLDAERKGYRCGLMEAAAIVGRRWWAASAMIEARIAEIEKKEPKP